MPYLIPGAACDRSSAMCGRPLPPTPPCQDAMCEGSVDRDFLQGLPGQGFVTLGKVSHGCCWFSLHAHIPIPPLGF